MKNGDIVTANSMTPSCGTISEIIYANIVFKKPVYIINPNRMYLNDPWLKYHSVKIFEDVDKCFEYIIEKHSVEKMMI